MRDRIKKIYDHLEEDVDVIVLQNAADPFLDKSFFYVTGLSTGLFEGSIAVMKSDYSLEVMTSPLEEESARKGDFALTVFKSRDNRNKHITTRLKNIKKIGINSIELTYKNLLGMKKLCPKSKFIDVSEAIIKARVVKDGTEIDLLKKACNIASEVAEEIIDSIHEGIKEYEVAAELCYLMQKKGAVGPAFDTIAAFGKNSAEPHYTAGDARLKRGDFVLLDFGAKYMRYNSDITRTFTMGKASNRQREIYEVVLKAHTKALDEIREGANGKAVHNAAKDCIDKTKYKGKFTHGVGHSIGLATHDGCGLNPVIDITLKEGMVFTVEPGIYLPGFGGVRIEDDIIVKKDGYEFLTHATRDFIEI